MDIKDPIDDVKRASCGSPAEWIFKLMNEKGSDPVSVLAYHIHNAEIRGAMLERKRLKKLMEDELKIKLKHLGISEW